VGGIIMKILVNGDSLKEIIKYRFLNSDEVDMKTLDRMIGHIKRNKKQYMRLVYLIAIGFNAFGCPVFAAGIDTFDPLTLEFFGYIVAAVKAIMLIGMPVELIKCVSSGTVENLGKISIKYTALGLIIRFLPDIVTQILP